MEPKEKPIAYLLSTCPRCHRAKRVLDEIGVDYTGIEVDLLSQEERTEVMDKLKKHRPIISFPVLVIGDQVHFGCTAEDLYHIFGE